MFYNTFRTTTSENLKRSQNPSDKSKSFDPREKLIKIQKREKLKGLLITKFMKKYGITKPETILNKEISKFLEGERLTENDLKQLDQKINKILSDKTETENLKQNLLGGTANVVTSEDLILPELKDNKSTRSRANKTEKECDNLSMSASISSHRPPLNRLNFSNEGDEWNAICLYNQKMFEQEKINNCIKDLEIKNRTKDDLDNQIRQKTLRLNEEYRKNKEYDTILLKHVEYLNELEKEKQNEIKAKILREKENRDKQMKDEKHRKRIELLKEKKNDKEIVRHSLDEIEKERLTLNQKKIKEREALQKTLKDNELNKIKLQEQIKKEKEDDVRATQEYAKILEKQENERKEYFNKIERNSNSFMSKMAETVLKEMQLKSKEEEERIQRYLSEKESR